jgi:hypothetical protein
VIVDEARLRWAILASILLHALVLMSMNALRNLRLPLPSPPATIDVDLASLPPPAAKLPPQAQAKPESAPPAQPPPMLMPKQQIVTPPDAGVEKPPPDTAFLSDRDNTVEQQSVRRGEGPVDKPEEAKAEDEPVVDEKVAEEKVTEEKAKPQPAKPKASKSAPVAPRPASRAKPRERTEVASLPKLDKLFPLPGEFAARAPSGREGAEPEEPAAHRNLLRGGRQAFAISPGVSDYLPTVREGDITLLNTKAERFAPFVRRVAARVFQHLEIQLKRAARNAGNGSAGREFAVVEAVMNKRGELVNARLIERETNTQMTVYKQLLTAARPEVFFDANPPAGAEAADGNIHFVLLVDLMVQVAADPRTGRASTGYYGMAGVGLDAVPGG